MKKNPQKMAHVVLVASAGILFWRGAWGLMDLYIFPNDPFASYLISFGAGITILLLTKALSEDTLG